MLIWIFVEMAIIETYSWLQSLYFGLGVLELILLLALLGIAPSLATPGWPGRGKAPDASPAWDVRHYQPAPRGH